MLRWLTAGESHGPELVAILEGLPAGVPVSMAAIQQDLHRRTLGYGRGARQAFEFEQIAAVGVALFDHILFEGTQQIRQQIQRQTVFQENGAQCLEDA